jgi:hypothetical protein
MSLADLGLGERAVRRHREPFNLARRHRLRAEQLLRDRVQPDSVRMLLRRRDLGLRIPESGGHL